jgi:hypothetical protein
MSRVSVALKACATSVLLLAAPMLAGTAAAQTVGVSPATTTFKVASGAVGSGTTDASGTPISLTVFGRLFPQTVATGSYQDTITVSVSY